METTAPVPDGYVRLSNRVIERCWAALTALSQRRLMGPENEKKVLVLLRRHFEPAHRIVEELKNNMIIRDHPAPEDSDDADIPATLKEKRAIAMEAILDTTQDIMTVPDHLILTDADMPKPIKGEMGDANRTAVTEIKHKLEFLYPIDEEE
jgi:hypothetical protein